MISRRIFAAFALLCVFVCSAQAQFTKAQLNAQVGTNFPDQTVGAITPANARTISDNIVNSIMPNAPVVSGNLACFSGTTGLLQDCGSAPTTIPLTIGTTPVSGGSTTNIIYDNAGILGEYTVSGSGSVCMSTSCVMTTPNIGTPTAGVATNLSGTAASLTAGHVTTNANLTGDVTSSGNATTYSNVVPQAKGGAGTITGALKGSGAGVVSQAACADLSNGGTACSQGYTASTWTPTITTSGTAGTPAYSIQIGTYEQIGRQVTVRFSVTLSGWTGSPTGNVSISGLPIASGNTTNDYGVCHLGSYVVAGLAASNFGMGGFITAGTSVISLDQFANTTSSLVTAAQVGATPALIGMCSYHT